MIHFKTLVPSLKSLITASIIFKYIAVILTASTKKNKKFSSPEGQTRCIDSRANTEKILQSMKMAFFKCSKPDFSAHAQDTTLSLSKTDREK